MASMASAHLLHNRHVAETILKRTVEELRKPAQQASPDASSHGALLLGFTDSPLRLAGTTQSWQRIELTLLRLALPVKALPARKQADANPEK